MFSTVSGIYVGMATEKLKLIRDFTIQKSKFLGCIDKHTQELNSFGFLSCKTARLYVIIYKKKSFCLTIKTLKTLTGFTQKPAFLLFLD